MVLNPFGALISTSRYRVVSKLVCYHADQIPHVWEEVRGHIQRALDRGSNYSLQDIRKGLCRSKMQLWCWKSGRIEAALVTTIQTKQDVKFCLFLVVGGSKMDEWCDHMSLVEDWAKEVGCTEMRIYGRIGWARKLGYDINYTKMTRRL